MSFNDDEPIVADPCGEAGKSVSFPGGKVKLTLKNETEAPLETTNFTAMIELTGSGTGGDRAGVDLVMVLDVTEKIEMVKTAMQFVIRKLSPIDRLSVYINNVDFRRLFPLRPVTNESRPEMEALVINALNAFEGRGSDFQILFGVAGAVKILKERRLSSGRVPAIMLVFNGIRKLGDISLLKLITDFPVYTFGFGANYDPMALKIITDNSKGGTFSDVQNENDLIIAFSQCLAGLFTVVVQNLKLTITSAVVIAGNYPQTMDDRDESVIVSFGDLYNKETRKVLVSLTLPEVPKRISEDILEISYSYKDGKKLVRAETSLITITRTDSIQADRWRKELEVAEEETRVRTAEMMKEAHETADKGNIEDAKDMLAKAENALSNESAASGRPLLKMLRSELQQLAKLMRSEEIYKKKGRSFALSSQTSHDRQRFATRGVVEKLRIFSTPRMDTCLDQARVFEADPTKPVPSTEDDVKREIEADPLSTIAWPLSYYYQAAIQALQSIQKIIDKASP